MSGRRHTDAQSNELSVSLEALVVDDEEHFRAYVSALARRLGFKVETACDGLEAVQLTEKNHYDLVISDQEMPRMSGLEVVAEMRRPDHAACHAYAMMLTARDDMGTKIAALTAGYDDFVAKSAPELEIIAKIVAARRLATRQRALDTTVRELYGLATRDELTGVFNRRFFDTETAKLLVAGTSVSVVLFDLDGFKRINDTYGHIAGDRILRDVGALFLRATRPEDLIARYGGDEFVMVISDLALDDVHRVSERLAEEVAALSWTIDTDTVHIGMSCGIASSVLLADGRLEQLVEAADRDLYKNKWIRKNPEPRVAGPQEDVIIAMPAPVIEIKRMVDVADDAPAKREERSPLEAKL